MFSSCCHLVVEFYVQFNQSSWYLIHQLQKPVQVDRTRQYRGTSDFATIHHLELSIISWPILCWWLGDRFLNKVHEISIWNSLVCVTTRNIIDGGIRYYSLDWSEMCQTCPGNMPNILKSCWHHVLFEHLETSFPSDILNMSLAESCLFSKCWLLLKCQDLPNKSLEDVIWFCCWHYHYKCNCLKVWDY